MVLSSAARRAQRVVLCFIWCLGWCLLGCAAGTAGGAAIPPAAESQARIEKTQYRGWDVYRLTNGIISLYIAPQIGGRAIQLQLGEKEFFFVNPDFAGKVVPESQNNPSAGWANYGGDKVWPAPEGWSSDDEWPSIPYYILDGSRFDFAVVTETPAEVAVRVSSPRDPRTGVQFERTFHVYAATTRVKVEQVMRNVSRRQIRWGIWHLIQNDAADSQDASKPNPELYMYVPINSKSAYLRGFTNLYGDVRHPSYDVVDNGRLLRIHYLYRVGKVGVDSSAGWMAVVNGQKNIGLVENFDSFPEREYPDHASVEAWNDGPGTVSRGPFDQTLADDRRKTPFFLESEVLSPLARLDPGEQYEFTVYWSPTSVPIPVHEAVWAGAVSEPLTASVEGSQVTLRGIFGVFERGTLEAQFYNAIGQVIGTETLQQVDPREVVRLDKTVKLPADTYRVSVHVRDSNSENRGFLGNVILK
ncbi:MAG TPA: DUF4380 domain-containing protein [Terriglobia bacterium]